MNNNKQQSLENKAREGKSVKQKLEVMEEVMKGEKYIVIKGYKKEIHILPENKLKQMLEQSKEEERERIIGVIEKNKVKVSEDIYQRNVDLEVNGVLEDIIKSLN